MTNNTEALARVIEETNPWLHDFEAEALAQAILARPVMAQIRAEERAGIVAWLRGYDRDETNWPQFLANAIEARQDEGGSE